MKNFLAVGVFLFSVQSFAVEHRGLDRPKSSVPKHMEPQVVIKFKHEIGLKRVQALILSGHQDSESLYKELRSISTKRSSR